MGHSSDISVEGLKSTIDKRSYQSPATTNLKHEISIPDSPQLTEQAFLEWLVSEGGVSDSTAKQYISNIHSIEKLYQTLFGERKNFLGTNSADNARSMIESLIVRNEYIDANERRHNSFNDTLNQITRFLEIYVDGLVPEMQENNHNLPESTLHSIVKEVDFNTPQYYNDSVPVSFTLNNQKHFANSWFELYTKFLIILSFSSSFSDKLKDQAGRSLYGQSLNFTNIHPEMTLRKPIKVSNFFFAEGDLSTVDIIKHIKCIMDICDIDDDHMRIEYAMSEAKSDNSKKVEQPEPTVSAIEDGKIENNDIIEWLISVLGLSPAIAKSYYSSITTAERIAREHNLKSQRLLSAQSYAEARETFNELLKCDTFIQMNATAHNSLTAGVRKLISYMLAKSNTPSQEITPSLTTTEHDQQKTSENTAPTPASFTPDTTKPFVLKDAVIEILLTDAPEISKYHEHNGFRKRRHIDP